MAEAQCDQCGHYVYEHDEKGRCWCDTRTIHRSALDVKDQHDKHEHEKRREQIAKELGY